MCTVSYIPQDENRFVFTSNRDENPLRAATELHKLEINKKTLYFPQDSQAKGSWFVFSNTNQMVCILNGAFEPHLSASSYRMSRGKMALQFFEYPSIQNFVDFFEFKGLEPFTMVVLDAGELTELRWDEQKLYKTSLDRTKTHLWSSATLYPKSWQETRKKELEDWFGDDLKGQEEVMEFQLSKFPFTREALVSLYGEQVPQDIPVQTISVSSIQGSKQKFVFKYKRAKELLTFEKTVDFD